MKTKLRHLVALLALVAAGGARPADPGAGAPSFGGELGLGGVFRSVRTSMASSAAFGLVKLGEAAPDSLNERPKVQNGLLPVVTLNLHYSCPRTGTQLFAGGVPGDALQFEYLLQGGVRQAMGSPGTLSLAYLYGLPVKVWADPYVAGARRSETSRGSQGARLGWERIFGSGLQAQYTFRRASVAREDSGSFLGLVSKDARRLRRAGDIHQAEVRYALMLSRVQQLTPALVYTREDLQGKAMSAQGQELRLRYTLRAGTIVAMLEGSIGRSLHDGRNPVFLRTETDTRVSGSVTLLFRAPFGWEPFGSTRWSLFATGGYAAAFSNIDFYSTSILGTAIGLSTQF